MNNQKVYFPVFLRDITISLAFTWLAWLVFLFASDHGSASIAQATFVLLFGMSMSVFAIAELWYAIPTLGLFLVAIYASKKVKNTKYRISLFVIILTLWSIYGSYCGMIITGE